MQAAFDIASNFFESRGAKITKAGICGGCGAPMYRTELIVLGEKINTVVPCKPCEEYELQLQSRENAKRDEKLKRQKVFNQNSLMNDLLKEATFEGYIQEHETQKDAFKLSLTWLNALLKKEYDLPFNNVLLFGKVGRGKSHLAAATAKALNEAGKDALFVHDRLIIQKAEIYFSQK